MTAEKKSKTKLLYAIIIAIIAASFTGGFFPEFAAGLSLIGEIFLNLLMMIVIPLVFVSMITGIKLGPAEQMIVAVTATLAAIGAAGIPEAGLVTMVIVLTAAGLPIEGIGIILTVDWLLDRFRTTVNVWGDLVCAGMIDRDNTASEPPIRG